MNQSHCPDTCPVCPRRNPNARTIHGARIQFACPSEPITPAPHAPNPIMFVGDMPDSNANRRGVVMAGKLGREFDECYLPAAGLDRAEVYITNAVKCQWPDTNPPDVDTARQCGEWWLGREIAQVRPRAVVAMGALAAKVLVGRGKESERVDVETHHGQLYGRLEYTPSAPHEIAAGYAPWVWGLRQPLVMGYPNVPLIITQSPAAGLAGSARMTTALGDFIDLRRVLACVERREYPHRVDQYPFPLYGELTTPAQVWEALGDKYSITRGRWVAVDTETDGLTGPPWCLSFSTAPGVGWVIPADAPAALTAFNNWVNGDSYRRVLLHNAMFDLDVLGRMGVGVPRWRDTMHTAYQLGDQPQGLKPLAWRLAGMEMVDYSEVVRGPSVAPMLEWAARVQARITAAIPQKQPRKKLVLDPAHKEWKKQAGLLGRLVTRVKNWQVAQLFIDTPGDAQLDLVEFPSPWKWWGERTPQVRGVLGMFGGGPMPQESIVHVPRNRAIQYAGRDADATLRAWLELRRLVRALQKQVQPGGDQPRVNW